MKHLLTLAFIFTCLLLSAQAQDSTDIKLQHYKDMFVKGLITSQEYEQLKAQTLGLKPAPQNVVIMKQQAPNEKPLPKMSEQELQAMHNRYKGGIVAGSIFISIGGILLLTDVPYNLGLHTTTGVVLITALGVVCTVVGIAGLVDGVHTKRAYKRQVGEAFLKIKGNGISLAYNF